jgi:putative uncharacterized protein (fragment)
MALLVRRRIFHFDQRWAYQMKSYTNRLKEERIFQSMSRKGNCLDNSVMENFFGLLKQEIYYGRVYHSCEELKTAIEEYVVYYNERRIKKSLGWMDPAEVPTQTCCCITKAQEIAFLRFQV